MILKFSKEPPRPCQRLSGYKLAISFSHYQLASHLHSMPTLVAIMHNRISAHPNASPDFGGLNQYRPRISRSGIQDEAADKVKLMHLAFAKLSHPLAVCASGHHTCLIDHPFRYGSWLNDLKGEDF